MNIEYLTIHHDQRGDLIPIYFKDLPFKPVRLFYVSNIPINTKRGGHGHYNCKQYYICIKGIIEIELKDGLKSEIIQLTEGETIFIDNMIWTSEKFCTHNDILLVLCSHEYNAFDYYN